MALLPTQHTQPKLVDAENKFTIYANHVAIAITAFDLRVIFGQLEPQKVPEEQMIATMAGSVIMSPLQVKVLIKSLQTGIDAYEKLFGQINLPAIFQAPPTAIKGQS